MGIFSAIGSVIKNVGLRARAGYNGIMGIVYSPAEQARKDFRNEGHELLPRFEGSYPTSCERPKIRLPELDIDNFNSLDDESRSQLEEFVMWRYKARISDIGEQCDGRSEYEEKLGLCGKSCYEIHTQDREAKKRVITDMANSLEFSFKERDYRLSKEVVEALIKNTERGRRIRRPSGKKR